MNNSTGMRNKILVLQLKEKRNKVITKLNVNDR